MKRIAFYDTHSYEQEQFEKYKGSHQITYLQTRLSDATVELARDHQVVCSFVNDRLNAAVLRRLSELGIELVALRSAGFNNVDLAEAHRLKLPVVRVPEYSPHAVAEHAVALMMTLNRKTHRAYNRVRELNFELEGLVGFDIFGKTAGVVGTGRIGACLTRILTGFGCRVLAFDPHPDPALPVTYVPFETLLQEADILSLHAPLTSKTRHLLDPKAFARMKKNAILINTSRGGLVDSKALLSALKSHAIAGAALDVYEEEEGIFFEDHSSDGVGDDVLARLLTFPNVLITSHQGFLTREALMAIAQTTMASIEAFDQGRALQHALSVS